MAFVLTSIFLIVILLFFIKIKWGIFLYILLVFLVPTLDISMIGGIKWITFNTMLLIAMIIFAKKKKIAFFYTPFKPFIFLYLYYLLIIPFQFTTNYSYQFSSFFGQFFRYFILPICILTICKNKQYREVNFYNVPVYISIAIACIYGLILTQLEGINPYLLLMIPEDAEKLISYGMPTEGRLFGRVFSVFPHPMTFGVFLISSFCFCFNNLIQKKQKVITIILLILISANIITCGIRSVIGAILVGLFTFILLNKKSKYLLYISIILIIIFIIISTNEILTSYVSSIFTSADSSNVKGSSIELRIEQLLGCFSEISSNFLFGKGYNWTTLYNTAHGDHPIILAFESLIFVIICNWGIIGMLIWCIFLFKLYKTNNRLHLIGVDKFHILNTYTATYLSYTCITGDYAYTLFWTFFYMLIYINLKSNKI